ncbi:hypothetical protein [Oceanospirillum sediminis]|uniref:Lipoprotein n=1 Tax=Oceanospirillum sediminis TaxID=2760088 RepID=A0A839IT31_9GAMM|nr:hypothetical protein [Oceanospirillum sediminis]MBB1487772.1 hypothetical protein [Oceanospirillum sediminis]
MLKKQFILLPVLAVTLISGCASVNDSPEISAIGYTKGDICTGQIDNIPDGLTPVSDPALLAEASGEPGKGKLCTGQVFEATQPVRVYRVWNSEKDYTKYGRWWSFEQPVGPKDKYRKDNGICPSWSSLDVMTHCDIKVGARVVVGPGQSARCKKFTFDQSAVNQVYISNDTRENRLWVEACSQATAWPE